MSAFVSLSGRPAVALSESVTDDSDGDCGIRLPWISGVSAESIAALMPTETMGTVVAVFERHDGQRSDQVVGECKNSDGPV